MSYAIESFLPANSVWILIWRVMKRTVTKLLLSLVLFAPALAQAAESPDLVTSAGASPTSLTPGQSYTISATVQNLGANASAATTVRYYQSVDATITTGDSQLGSDSIPALAMNGSSSQNLTATASSDGTFWVGACVDPVADESPTTNQCSGAVQITVYSPRPDLVVNGLSVSAAALTPGQSFTIYATVKNQGTASSGSTTLRYYRSTNSTINTADTPLGTGSVAALSAGGSSNQNLSTTDPGSEGYYWVGACVDAVAGESPTNNQCSAGVQITVSTPRPDLTVVTPSVSDATLTPGQAFTINATAKNVGTASADTSTLRYYRSTDATITTADTVLPGTDPIPALAPNGTSPQSLATTDPDTDATYWVGACVDVVANESNTNNQCSIGVQITVYASRPDLVVIEASVSAAALTPGQAFTINATAKNQGDAASVSSTLHYYRSTDATITTGDTGLGGDDSIVALSPGWTSPQNLPTTAPATEATYWVGACVDAVTGESNITNQCSAAVQITVFTPKPDMVISGIYPSPSSLVPNQLFTIYATVYNQGTLASNSTTVHYYRSTDATITTGDTQLGTDPVEALSPGAASQQNISATSPGSVGYYYIGACVDAVAGETNISNQCSTGYQIVVATPKPDLRVYGASVSDNTLAPDQSFTIYATAYNQGSANASYSTTLRYYRSADSNITTADTLLGTDPIPVLSSGQSSSQNLSATAPSATGTYWVGACVDAISGEEYTTNQCSSGVRITVATLLPPNVMILLDSSGKMGDSVQSIADYAHATTYGTCDTGNYATAKVYRYDTGSYIEYAAAIVDVLSPSVQDALTERGFWFGILGASSLKLFHGNYLNYEFCPTLTSRTKLSIAKSVINTAVGAIKGKRFGVMKFNSGSTGGEVIAQIGTSSAAIATAVNAISAAGSTPLGPQLRDAGYYFDGSFGYTTPIQDQCQQNSVFIISDGGETASPWVVTQAASEYTRDHSTSFTGTQNLSVNAVSFYLNPATDAPAISSLTAAAYSGGGVYLSANDPAQLAQAFFLIPPGIAVTAPLANSMVSSNTVLSAAVGNSACVTSVQFQVDGSTVGSVITAPPFTYNWNSNSVLNGTHTITAIMIDGYGNTNISFPTPITTNNDQTPPAISNVLWTTWYTSATVTWQTAEAGDTQVEYGTTTAYGAQTTLNAALVTTHSQSIRGLAAGTIYHSKVKSKDALGNLAAQGDYSFTTNGIPITAPAPNATVLGNVTLSVGANSEWASVQFKVDGVNKGAPITAAPFNYIWRSTEVANGSHIITAAVLDKDGRTNVSIPLSVTTNNDQTPPAVSGVGWTVWYTSAAVTWQTDESGDTQVEYGTTTAYGSQTTLNTVMVTTHTQSVRGLPTLTTYHSKMKSRDAAGNLASQGDYVFTTNGIPLTAPLPNAAVSGNVTLSVGANSEWASVQFKVDSVNKGSAVTSPPFSYVWNSTDVASGGHTITAAVLDKDGHVNISLPVSVTVNNDQTPPAITGVGWTVWYTSAAVTWQTDELGDTQVEYGTTTAYGTLTTLNTSAVTTHTQSVRGLPTETTYHSKVKSRDAAGNLAAQSDYVFTTNGIPLTAPEANDTVVGNVTLSVGANSEWASVQFKVDGVNKGSPVTTPFTYIWNSTDVANGGHTVTAAVLDNDGRTNITFPVSITVNNDATPPVITGVGWTVWYTSAAVTWQTDEPADTQVEYGLTTAYGAQTTLNTSMVTTHTQAVRGLPTVTTYHSKVDSRDSSGNLTTQSDYVFATNGIPLTAPAANAVVSGTVTLSVGANSEWASVQFKVDGTNKGAPVSSPPFNYIWNSTDVVNGAHTITAAVLDKDGNTNISLPVSVTVGNDQTPPVITGVGWTVWYTSAAVTWQTDEQSDTQVEYGTTTAYGAQTTLNAALVTTHTQSVRGLPTGTLYHSKVKSRDALGSLAAQSDYVFTTNGIPLTAPAANATVVGNVTLSVGANSEWVSVQFKVDGSTVSSAITAPFNYTWDSNSVTNGGHTITALVLDTDGHTNNSLPVSITVGNNPSGITGVAWTVWYTSASVTWQTDMPADTQVEYGLTTAYGMQTTLATAMVATHTQSVRGLPTGTLYHSKVKSRNGVGILAEQGDYLFTTNRIPLTSPAANATVSGNVTLSVGTNSEWVSVQFKIDGVNKGAPVTAPFNYIWRSTEAANGGYTITAAVLDTDGNTNISLPVSVTVNNDWTPPVITGVAWTVWYTSAAVTWQTNEQADTQVEYGLTTAYGAQTTLNAAMVTTHTQSVRGLPTGTMYHSKVKSRDPVGNFTTQSDYLFTTNRIPLSSPTANATVSGNVVLSVGANSEWASVQFKVDGVNQGSPVTAPFNYTWNSNAVPNGGYTITAAILDTDGNTNISLPVPVTVNNDITPPVITGVGWTVWYTSASVTWQTNEPADTQVEYGLTTAYGAQTTLDAALVATHTQSVRGLPTETMYHSKVKSRDASTNLTTQSDYVFTTRGIPLTAPLSNATVSGNVVLSVGSNSEWASVQFKVDGVNKGSPVAAPPFNYTWNCTDVSNGAHIITAAVLDKDGNTNTSLPISVTVNNDITPPVITGVDWTVWYTSATAIWQTSEPADTQVEYGTTTAYGAQTTLNAALVTTHTQSVRGLPTETTYHSKVKSKDASANLTTQSDYVFTTRGIPLTAPLADTVVLGNVLLSIGANSAWVSVQFKVDGNNRGAPVTAPFNYIWNSNDVANGGHTVTAAIRDTEGNTNISLPVSVTVSNDRTPPVISGVNWTIWYTSAAITWQTDEPADTQINYGTTTAYGSLYYNDVMGTNHSVLLTGLYPGNEYHSTLRSKDADLNITVYGDNLFITNAYPIQGELDHLQLSFGTARLPGPGAKSGNNPYALTAGNCYGLTIEAINTDNTHYPLDAVLQIVQYSLDDSGAEVSLIPGIALNSLYELGVSTLVVAMKSGYAYLGSETDPNEKICFYRASRAPGTYPSAGAGDFRLKVTQISSPTLSGISADYVGWPGYARSISLLSPYQTLAPATPTGVTGATAVQMQGTPFFVQAYLVDAFFNNTYSNTDTLRFTSSLSAQTGFFPFEGAVVNGLLVSSVTVDACAVLPILSVQDLTTPSIANGQITITMGACDALPPGAGFYQVAIPGLGKAGDPFAVTITVKNVSITPGAGSVRYAGNLIPLVPLDLTHFTYASGVFGLPAFEFSIPDGYVGDYVYTLNNQTYTHNEVVWMQLVATAPNELNHATALGGPMQVLPGDPERLTASASPNTIGPLSSTIITTKLMDRYGNGIPNADIAAQVRQGTGDLNVGGVPASYVTVQTGANGAVTIPFISHQISETDKVTVWVPGVPGIPEVELTISITLLGDKNLAAYPNPTKITVRPVTIEYKLDDDSDVELLICTPLGQKVWLKEIAAGSPGGLAGYNTVEWNGRNGAGHQVAVGVYGLHLRVTAKGHTSEIKTRLGIIK
ncbi:MAG TPA: hypothetical protein DCL44_05135 [Elusimicrobia bacterium]|nr:hypothetical protein [Elusimicrobiota bacterium]